MLKKRILFLMIIFSFLVIRGQVIASSALGTIDSIYHYAWGENVGFIDFKNITINDYTLSGSAYGENIGWVDLSTIINDNEGNLSGYAWGENIGFVDFSNTKIDKDGVFRGSAYGENIGFIIFGSENNKVITDWRPKSTRNISSSRNRSGSRPSLATIIPATNQIITNPSNTPAILNIIRNLKLTSPQMKGDDIKLLQIYLNNHGYDTGIIDGIFGPKTKQTVISFQKTNKIIPDGIVGPITRALLK